MPLGLIDIFCQGARGIGNCNSTGKIVDALTMNQKIKIRSVACWGVGPESSFPENRKNRLVLFAPLQIKATAPNAVWYGIGWWWWHDIEVKGELFPMELCWKAPPTNSTTSTTNRAGRNKPLSHEIAISLSRNPPSCTVPINPGGACNSLGGVIIHGIRPFRQVELASVVSREIISDMPLVIWKGDFVPWGMYCMYESMGWAFASRVV